MAYLMGVGSNNNNSVFNRKTYPMVKDKDKMETICGHEYPILSWPEVEERYPDNCVIYTNDYLVKDGRYMMCTVLAVCDKLTSFEEINRFRDLGIYVHKYRVSSGNKRF